MAQTTKRKGAELISIGFVDSKDEKLINILKNNGYYLKKKRFEQYDREHYEILREVDDQ